MNHRAKYPIFVLGAAIMVTGCAGPKYACKAPEGIPCMSIGEVYKKSVDGALPATRAVTGDEKASDGAAPVPMGKPAEAAVSAPATTTPYPVQLTPGAPLRQDPTVLMVWFTPWVDADGDFHDQSYLYLVTDPGRWLLHENRHMGTARSFRRLDPPAVRPAAETGRRTAPPAMTAEEAREEAVDLVGGKDQKDPGGR